MKVLYIIDFNNIFFKIFTAVKTSIKGRPIVEFFRFISKYIQSYYSYDSDICFVKDMGVSVRHKLLYKEYKENRSDYHKIFDAETLDEVEKIIKQESNEKKKVKLMELKKLKEEYLLVPKIFQYLGIPLHFKQHIEADDLISLIIYKIYDKYDRIFIFSTDTDFYQLIDYNKIYVINFNEIIGFNIDTDSLLIGTKLFKEVYGYIPPFYLSFVKSIMGDTSDNIKGVPNIGKQTLLKGYFNSDNKSVLKKNILKYKTSEEAYSKFMNMLTTNKFTHNYFKKLLNILRENKESFILNFRLVDLNPERLINEEFGKRVLNQLHLNGNIISIKDFFKTITSQKFYKMYLKLKL